MTTGLFFYRLATIGISPILPFWFRHRTRTGKESRARLHERFARELTVRPQGQLVWLHGASIGESKLLLAIIKALQTKRPGMNFLMTSQTASAAKIIADNLPPNTLHQMAPMDTPATSRRFISHWSPDLFVLAESEVWPNLLARAQASGVPAALINARMTSSSLKNWRTFSSSAKKLFAGLDLINATDKATANLLSDMTGRDIPATSNLKIGAMSTSACQPPENDQMDSNPESSKILLGASTHDGEERLLIDAFQTMPENAQLILAPRHTDRANEISDLLDAAGLKHARRSQGGTLSPETPVLIADTFGEMDRWYARADLVYLGGAHKTGIGGHNPLEPLRFGKPVLSGPDTFNFSDVFARLADMQMVRTVTTSAEIQTAFSADNRVDTGVLDEFLESGKRQFDQTVDALLALIDGPAT